jgi:hypothetical protein
MLAATRSRTPLFLDLADPGDRVVSVNSFPLMTGWRLG